MPARRTEDDEYHPPHLPPRPRRQNTSNQFRRTSGAGGGLLSNVFSFVSREIGEFVVNATGGAEQTASQPAAGPSRERDGDMRRTEKRNRRQSTPAQPQHDMRASKRVRKDKGYGHMAQLSRDKVVDHNAHEQEERDTSLSSSPLPRRPRRASVSMPGSLFSRSPTPDTQASPPDSQGRHVRFASDVVSPVPRQRHPIAPPASEPEVVEEYEEESHSDDDYNGDSSSSPDRAGGSSYPPLPPSPRRLAVGGSSSHAPPTTPFRPAAIPSVKAVVARLDGESPTRRPSTPTWSSNAKEKVKEVEYAIPWPSTNKGKSREHVRPHLEPMSRLSSTIGSVEGARRVDVFLRSDAVNAEMGLEHGRGSTVRDEADKQRIRELEERVKTLENELARSQTHFPSAPPPPPPPPPPVPGSSTSRIPLSNSPRREPWVNGVYASVRAGLRQTSSSSETSKTVPKNRLPIVPADKMEAFLSELKTVRLRKVGSVDDLSRDSAANSSSAWSGRNRSQSSSQDSSSLQEDRPTAGYKRKRVDSGNEAQSALFTSIKRRFNVPQSGSSVPSSSVTGPLPSKKSFLIPRHPSTSSNPRSSIPNPQEVVGATPSLCSDNSNDVEERAPSTPPPAPSRPVLDRLDAIPAVSTIHGRVEVQAPRARHRESNIRDPHIYDVPEKPPPPRSPVHPVRSHTPSASQGSQSTQQTLLAEDTDNPFSRRLPSSPMLPETPRRPRPPARVRSATKSASRPRGHSRSHPAPDDGSDDDPLSMSFPPPNKESTPAPVPVGRRRIRRLTLEDEMRKAESSYSYSEEERAVTDLESGELIGVGQRSKRLGFLAHGGAGGDPVFMGVGYVEGALGEEGQTSDVEKEKKKKKRSTSAAGSKRRPKR